MTDDPTPDDIDALVAQIDDNTPWDVEDWQHTTGRYDAATVTLEVEWDPLAALDPKDSLDLARTAKEIVEQNENGEGVPINTVVERVVESSDVNEDMAHEAIDKLKQKGEVYEPRTDHLRST